MVIEMNPPIEGQQDGVATPSGLPTDEKAVIPGLLAHPSENQAKYNLSLKQMRPRAYHYQACPRAFRETSICSSSASTSVWKRMFEAMLLPGTLYEEHISDLARYGLF